MPANETISPPSADKLFERIGELVRCHSPSGAESEIDLYLKDQFWRLGIPVEIDACGNLIARIPGRGPGKLAITAHKDEIGAIVTKVEEDGRIRAKKLGGSFPWIYGEGPVDLLGESETVPGILSFGSRHVSHASPQFTHKDSAPVKWEDTWIETKRSAPNLLCAGIRPGTKVVVGSPRKQAIRMGDFIGSFALDNKASLAVMLELAECIKEPEVDVLLVATTKEEIGAIGALHFTHREAIDAMIALEVAPVAPEYTIKEGPDPVILAEDSFGPYDDALNRHLRTAGHAAGLDVQIASVNGFGCDASIAFKAGHIPRAACLGFPTQNTHGFEIAHLGAIGACVQLLERLCHDAALHELSGPAERSH